jgi:hypothetical protein
MVRSSRRHIKLLRQQLIDLTHGQCEWPGCRYPGQEMAHIRGKGMGGSAERNTIDNVAWLCVHHHRTYDGGGPSEAWTTHELAKLGVEYQPGAPGTKALVREALTKHVTNRRAARRGGRLSAQEFPW